jgi:hypothetical protein
MLNTKDLWAEQAIAQERYQAIVRTRAAERARARSRQHQTTLRSRALSRVGQLWQRVRSQPSARYDAVGEQTA